MAAPTTAQGWLTLWNLSPNAGDEFAAILPNIVARSVNCPNGWAQWTKAWCEANLRARTFLYFRQRPGDCGNAVGGGQNTGLVIGGAAAEGAQIGARALGAGTAAASATLNAIPIVGAIASLGIGILGAFQAAHARAVATEQQTGCAVAAFVSQAVQGLDTAVKSGQVPSDQAVAATLNMYNQAYSTLEGIVKSECDFGQYAQGFVNAFVLFAQAMYPQWAGTQKPLAAKAKNIGIGAAIVAGGAAAAYLL